MNEEGTGDEVVPLTGDCAEFEELFGRKTVENSFTDKD